MRVINFWGAPGAGKSTTAAGLFWMMKTAGYKVELVSEYAKTMCWSKRDAEMDDQLYLFAKQHHALHVLKGKVDFVITDSPLPLSLIYGTSMGLSFHSLVMDTFFNYTNLNYYIRRVKPYVEAGRWQTEDGSDALAKTIVEFMFDYDLVFHTLDGNEKGLARIFHDLEMGTKGGYDQ